MVEERSRPRYTQRHALYKFLLSVFGVHVSIICCVKCTNKTCGSYCYCTSICRFICNSRIFSTGKDKGTEHKWFVHKSVPVLHARNMQGSSLHVFSCCIDCFNFRNMNFQPHKLLISISSLHLSSFLCQSRVCCWMCWHQDVSCSIPVTVPARKPTLYLHYKTEAITPSTSRSRVHATYLYESSAKLTIITPHKC